MLNIKVLQRTDFVTNVAFQFVIAILLYNFICEIRIKLI